MPIIVINSDNSSKFDDIASKSDMLLRYHSPSCGHCIAMESEWKALDNEQSLKEKNIAVVDIDVGIAYNINHPSAKTAMSNGVPAIYFIKKNQIFEYSGERKAKKIAEFAILHRESPEKSDTSGKSQQYADHTKLQTQMPLSSTTSDLVSKLKRKRMRKTSRTRSSPRRKSTNKRNYRQRRSRYSYKKYGRKLN